MCHAGDTDAVLALLYTGPMLWIFFCLFLTFCFSKPKLARTQHKFEKTQRVHIQRSGTQHRYRTACLPSAIVSLDLAPSLRSSLPTRPRMFRRVLRLRKQRAAAEQARLDLPPPQPKPEPPNKPTAQKNTSTQAVAACEKGRVTDTGQCTGAHE